MSRRLNTVRLDFTLWGPDAAQAAALVEGFKGRCPLYGTVAVAVPDVRVTCDVGE